MKKLFGEVRSMSNNMKTNFAEISLDVNPLEQGMVKLKSEMQKILTTSSYRSSLNVWILPTGQSVSVISQAWILINAQK